MTASNDRIGTLSADIRLSIVGRDAYTRGLSWLARRTGPLIWWIGVGMLMAYLGATVLMPKPDGRVVVGDATHHFVQLRSAVFDRDLDFRNEYVRLYGLTREEPGTDWIFTELTPTGHVRNYMPVGPAILWAPLYLLVAGLQTLLSLAGLVPRPDGFDRVLQAVPGATGVMAATAAAWLAWRLAVRWASPIGASIGVLAVWLGSSAIYYSLVSPSYSHAASMFATALFFLHWLSPRREWTVSQAAVSGALAGFASLMRWQDALLLAIPAFEAVRMPQPWPRRLAAAAAAGLGWAVVFSPQMLVWHVLYGQALAVPQGPAFMQWLSPHPIAVLLSDNHGLLSWTPVIILSLAGLVAFARRHPRDAWPLAFVVLAAWYVNAAVADWWAGEAFGARRFLSLFPLFVLGLATWIRPAGAEDDPPRWRLGAIAALVAVTWLLLLQYQVFMKGYPDIAPYPKGAFEFWVARFVVPFRLIAAWFA
jgi:hypothetical protein